MQSPPFPRYLVPSRSKYSPQHHVLKHPQLPFLPQCQRPSFTPIQNNSQNYILNSVRQHIHFITQGNYKAICFDYRLDIFRPILSIMSQNAMQILGFHRVYIYGIHQIKSFEHHALRDLLQFIPEQYGC